MVGVRRVSGVCKRGIVFSSTSFNIRRKSGVKVIKVGKAKGSALLGIITKRRIPSRKRIIHRGNLGVTFIPRGPAFPRKVSVHSCTLRSTSTRD